MTQWEKLLNTPADLNTYLKKLDEKLAQRGVSIQGRVLQAWREIQMDMGISMGISSDWMQPVQRYFDNMYGKRQAIDLSVRRALMLINRTPWPIRFPIVFGTCALKLADLIEDCPSHLLTDIDRSELNGAQKISARLFDAFEVIRAHHLPIELQSDWISAVDQAARSNGSYGVSQWSSQQVVEKVLKQYITTQGTTPPFIHDLEKLAKIAESKGLFPLDRNLLKRANCAPAVRYSETPVSPSDAVETNQASILLCAQIAKQWPR